MTKSDRVKGIALVLSIVLTALGILFLSKSLNAQGTLPPVTAQPSSLGKGKDVNPVLSPEKLEDIEIFETVTRTFPENAYLVAHVNVDKVKDPNKWWGDFISFIEQGNASIPKTIPYLDEAKSITYAAYRSQGDSINKDNHPLSKHIVITTNVETAEKMRQDIPNNEAWSDEEKRYIHFEIFNDDEKDRAYVIFGTKQEYKQLISLGNQITGVETGDDYKLENEFDTFDTSLNKTLFSVDEEDPTIYINIEEFVKGLSLSKTNNESSQEFWDTLVAQGVGLEKNSIWIGHSTQDALEWKGKFISGGINAQNIDLDNVRTVTEGQFEFFSERFPDQKSLEDAIEKNGPTLTDFGLVDPGLALVFTGGLSIAHEDSVYGQYYSVYDDAEEELKQSKAGKDILNIEMSPRLLLRGLGYGQHDTKMEYVTFTHNTSTGEGTIKFTVRD